MHVLYQDEHLVAIDKPPSYHVHPPENDDYPVPRARICMYRVRDELRKKVFPVHRLDVATSGVLLFALNSETASALCAQFAEHSIGKTYWAVTRGWTPEEALIDMPLESDSSGLLVDARTSYRKLAQVELPFAVGKRFPTARYSWLEVQPQTGRHHQIRRHFNRLSFPLVGDGTHGDSRHNQFFREQLGIAGLCLRAHKLSFTHPVLGKRIEITAPPREKWERIRELFNTPSPHEQI